MASVDSSSESLLLSNEIQYVLWKLQQTSASYGDFWNRSIHRILQCSIVEKNYFYRLMIGLIVQRSSKPESTEVMSTVVRKISKHDSLVGPSVG
ncbi:hypothetical protein EVAR_69965_1 [Eumeta japonica]|uniref:Uncharacterized protein n=1 Tax=Eumeta variegata TaxID=151549 RepID=A0A4C1TPM2_EUMVA|nr:hypothetical protein EVAR_69965_1 [Eumeta japonica]